MLTSVFSIEVAIKVDHVKQRMRERYFNLLNKYFEEQWHKALGRHWKQEHESNVEK